MAFFERGTGNNWLVGGDGPDTLIGGTGKDRIIGGTVHNVIDGNGGDDLINTRGAPSVVAHHRHAQLVDGAGASLHVNDKHVRYTKVDPITSSVKPIIIPTGPGGPGGYNLAQISHLYGVDALGGINPEFPIYTNSGQGQTIAIVGSRPIGLLGIGQGLEAYEAANGLPIANPVNVVNAPNQTGGGFDQTGALETALDVEWAHGLAPGARIVLVTVDSVNGSFFGSDLIQGMAEAANQLNRVGGGVVSMSFGSSTEDPIFAAQVDQITGSKYNRNISWVASAGDNAGDLSNPAMSQYVTSIGGTATILDASGNPVINDAWLYGGGGVSVFSPLPVYQQGLTINGKPVGNKRVGPDLSLIAESNGGAVKIYIAQGAVVVQLSVSGTSVGAPIFSGMVALANELRSTLRTPILGAGLNTEIYKAYHNNPLGTFTDVISGNNTHQAYFGYDLASGLGTPNANVLVPALGGVVVSNLPLTLQGDEFAALGAPLVGVGIAPASGVGFASIGPRTIALVLNGTGATQITGQVNVPRALDGSFTGFSTVGITRTTVVAGVSTTTTTVYNVKISGKVYRTKGGREHLNGTVVTIDPITGARLHQGLVPVFEATISA